MYLCAPGNNGSRGGAATGGPPANANKKKIMVGQQLAMLLHAHKCHRRDCEIMNSGKKAVEVSFGATYFCYRMRIWKDCTV